MRKVVDDRKENRSVEVIIGKERRRSWRDDEKEEIKEERFVNGENIYEVERKYGVRKGMMKYWRR